MAEKLDNQLQKTYKMTIAKSYRNIRVPMPWEAIERAARLVNLSVEEFVERYVAIAHYGNDDGGVYYTFEAK